MLDSALVLSTFLVLEKCDNYVMSKTVFLNLLVNSFCAYALTLESPKPLSEYSKVV